MKPRCSNQSYRALTLVEVVVIITILAFFAVILLPALQPAKRKGGSNCVNNLKEIGLAYQVWAGDNNGKFPMEVSATNGGALELAATGNAVAVFLVMSNELSTPKILLCQQDRDRTFATNFDSGFHAKNISYFVGLDANAQLPQALLSGDDNFEIGGVPVKSGLCSISTNVMYLWSTARHNRCGNVALADGSVQQLINSNLANLLYQTGLSTNHLAIP